MKISQIIILVCLIGIIMFYFSMTQSEINSNSNANVNIGNLSNNYDFATTIQNSGTYINLVNAVRAIQDTNNGWFVKVVAGIAAVPLAVMLIPNFALDAVIYAGNIVTGILGILGIPSYIILVIILIITIYIIFKVLEGFQRTQW